MEQIEVFDDLYQFNTYHEQINLSFNQYLLLGAEPMLIHTGNSAHVIELLPKLKGILGTQPLVYIFVSHFEGDECGGLEFIMKYFPQAKIICSEVTARQLQGFGFKYLTLIKKPGDVFETADYNLKFIGYPSEMHLWEGLLALENSRGLLFSSDLFIRMGKLDEAIVSSIWEEEVQVITPSQIPSPTAIKALQQELLGQSVNYIIPGHGPVLKV